MYRASSKTYARTFFHFADFKLETCAKVNSILTTYHRRTVRDTRKLSDVDGAVRHRKRSRSHFRLEAPLPKVSHGTSGSIVERSCTDFSPAFSSAICKSLPAGWMGRTRARSYSKWNSRNLKSPGNLRRAYINYEANKRYIAYIYILYVYIRLA